MEWYITKTLLIASDSRGRQMHLVRFDDGCWGITIDGQRHATCWPHGQLPVAARAYRDLVLESRQLQPPPACGQA